MISEKHTTGQMFILLRLYFIGVVSLPLPTVPMPTTNPIGPPQSR